jgi:hypothetical protein
MVLLFNGQFFLSGKRSQLRSKFVCSGLRFDPGTMNDDNPKPCLAGTNGTGDGYNWNAKNQLTNLFNKVFHFAVPRSHFITYLYVLTHRLVHVKQSVCRWTEMSAWT